MATQTKSKATEVAAEEVPTEEVEAPESVIEEVTEEVTPAKAIRVPEVGARIKVVELISDTTGEVPDGTRGSVFEVDEAEGTFKVLTDTAKLVTLVAGVDVWRALPKPKAEA